MSQCGTYAECQWHKGQPCPQALDRPRKRPVDLFTLKCALFFLKQGYNIYVLEIWQWHIGEGFLCYSARVYNIPATEIRKRDKRRLRLRWCTAFGIWGCLDGGSPWVPCCNPSHCTCVPSLSWCDCFILFIEKFWSKRKWNGLARIGPMNDKKTDFPD